MPDKEYRTYGPFDLPRNAGGFLDDSVEARRGFWNQVNGEVENLSSAKGCYIFCAGRGVKIVPWYVGKTNGYKGFSGEVFQAHKLNMYNRARQQYGAKKILSMIFIARVNANGRFMQKVPRRELEWLEKMIIGAALNRNENLTNKKDTKLLRELIVPGFLGTLRPGFASSASVRTLKRCLQ